ncbi:hypothetical protein NJI34_29275 [Pseudomonas sp. S 311-6]|uniref:hypothetical protein n=1 Tax=Kerstersia gyiorum TaxID=206506 RepID=UPI002096DE55|nr:hypothetical protein [Pseudomonas sp. S 311-6]
MTAFSLACAQPGQALPSRVYRVGTVQLFLYNAAIWNAHRIHYDAPYAQNVEHHPALVVDGPLQGDWLTQLIYEFMAPDDELIAFDYQNRLAAYLEEPLTCGGTVTGVDGATVTFTLQVSRTDGHATTVAHATVRRAAFSPQP